MHNSVLIVGEHDTGKSNYIGRCWIAAEDGRCAIKLKGELPEDFALIQTLSNSLLSGSYSQHTRRGSSDEIVLEVSLGTTHGEIPFGKLVLPDYSGEDFRSIYASRTWSQRWDSTINNSSGWLLLVRGDLIRPHFDYCQVQRQGLQLAHDNDEVSTDVLLVELLQLFQEQREVEQRSTVRLGIVVSCWDALPKADKIGTPKDYVRGNLPLLHQFVVANADSFDVRFFGLSSTSGNLNRPLYKRYYRRHARTAGYLICETNEGKCNRTSDITLPIAWALGQSDLG